MDQNAKDLLKKLVRELTDDGDDMGGLLYMQSEVVHWLLESRRLEEMEVIRNAGDFRMSAKPEDLVWLHSGPAMSQSERLVDFDRDERREP